LKVTLSARPPIGPGAGDQRPELIIAGPVAAINQGVREFVSSYVATNFLTGLRGPVGIHIYFLA